MLNAIEVRDLTKSYQEVQALAGVDLMVPAGSVLGLLGHNGAGKSTLIDILCTLALPDAGTASICGFDVVRSGRQVRKRVGVVGQRVTVDGMLSGFDNLVLVGRLLGAGNKEAKTRADELLTNFGLTDFASQAAGRYSGGMRRRLDLAMAMVSEPAVLFLDEPSVGLDPQGRLDLWRAVEQRVAAGTTVLLTTQYLEEADRLANRIVVLRRGKVVADGSTAELKEQVGSRTATVEINTEASVDDVIRTLYGAGFPVQQAAAGSRELIVPLQRSARIGELVRALGRALGEAFDLTLSEPSLEDVYLSLAAGQDGRDRQ